MPAPKRDITPWELTTNGARQHPGDGGPGLAEASACREMSRIPDSVALARIIACSVTRSYENHQRQDLQRWTLHLHLTEFNR